MYFPISGQHARTTAAASGPKKKNKRPNTRTLKAALSGECDVAALLRFLHDDVAAVRMQLEQQQDAMAEATATAKSDGDGASPAAASAGGSPARKRSTVAAGAYRRAGHVSIRGSREQQAANTTRQADSRVPTQKHMIIEALESFLVGHKVDIYSAARGTARSGRIVRYDLQSNKHLIAFDAEEVGEDADAREEKGGKEAVAKPPERKWVTLQVCALDWTACLLG